MADTLISLNTELKTWETLKGVLDGSLKSEDISLDFSTADWAKFNFRLVGQNFSQSLTAPVMAGIIDFQNALYKTTALVIKDDARILKLQDKEKSNFELIFKVGDGSTEILSEGKDYLLQLARTLAEKMTGRQLLIGVLVCALMFFGERGLSSYFEHGSEIVKENVHKESLKDLASHDENMIKILKEASKESSIADQIKQHSFEGFEAIIKRSGDANSIIFKEEL